GAAAVPPAAGGMTGSSVWASTWRLGILDRLGARGWAVKAAASRRTPRVGGIGLSECTTLSHTPSQGGASVKRLRTWIAGMAALLLVAGACLAADNPITLRGRVVDENGLPVGGAQVKLEMAGGQTFLGTTDDTGAFTIENLAAGEY